MQATAVRLPTQTRQSEIVFAALRLAKDCSPARVTTTDLADALGLSQGAIFKHFATKEAIWLAVMAWVSETLLHSLNAAVARATTPTEALFNVFDAHVGFVLDYPGVPRVIFHELQQAQESQLKQQVRSLMLGYRQLLLKLLETAKYRGDVAANLDSSAAATQFMGIVQGLVMQSMLSGDMALMKKQANNIFELYLRGIRATS